MNIKTVSIIAVCIGIVTIACAQTNSLKPLFSQEWMLTLHVVDEGGQPIEGADAKIMYQVPAPPGQTQARATKEGKTGLNGNFVATSRSHLMLECSVTKPGYYPTEYEYDLGLDLEKPRHEPWNPTIQLPLVKIGNPIPMYAKWFESGIPVENKPLGYDLMVGDWVAPHGKGLSTDIIFTLQMDKKAERDFDSKTIVTFPKPGDGIREFRIPSVGSALRSPHEAPLDGYEARVERAQSYHPGQPKIFDFDDKRNYFFRVRTVLNEKGQVQSALYGKIYGDLMKFRYYLNPTPNDRHIEFDPQRNLMQGLKSFERVHVP